MLLVHAQVCDEVCCLVFGYLLQSTVFYEFEKFYLNYSYPFRLLLFIRVSLSFWFLIFILVLYVYFSHSIICFRLFRTITCFVMCSRLSWLECGNSLSLLSNFQKFYFRLIVIILNFSFRVYVYLISVGLSSFRLYSFWSVSYSSSQFLFVNFF